jgi:replicative DNA helicase
LYMAHSAWYPQKKSVLFVSMEMMVPIIANRLTAMHSHLNLSHLNKATLSSKSFNKMRDDLVALQSHESPLYLMDGNLTATVEDIWSTANQLKPDIILIDGGYLLGHPNNKLDRFSRVAENTRLLKHTIATGLNIPVVCSWQFNRKAAKKKTEETGLEDIGFSDEIGQLSSIVLGLFEQESVETMTRRRIDIMKGRGGETGNYDIKWDFYKSDFGEYVTKPDEELMFL